MAKTQKRQIGDLCEEIIVKHLVKRCHNILSRNYLKPWGELDIVSIDVSQNPHVIHFIEVKGRRLDNSAYQYRPEENVTVYKLNRLWRTIQSWLMANPDYGGIDWQIDVVAVCLDITHKKAKIRWTKNIIIG